MIKGLTDRGSIELRQNRIDFTLFKGGKKRTSRTGKKIFGNDLGENLRLETKQPEIARVISKYYQTETHDGSIYLKELTILLAYNEIDRAFDCSMNLYDASGLISKCDRETIYAKSETFTDPYGHTRRRLLKTDEPCPIAGESFDCPNGCAKSGNLYFFIPALLSAGLQKLGKLSVHSYTDLVGINKKLLETEKLLGSIKSSPFPSPLTFNLIPYKLNRIEVPIKRPVLQDKKRTGKKADGSTWGINLEIHPDWLSQWQNHQLLKEVRQMGFAPSAQLISSAYGMPANEILEAKIIPENNLLLPSSLDNLISPEQGKELLDLVRDRGWSPEELKQILKAKNCNRLGELTVADYVEIKSAIDGF